MAKVWLIPWYVAAALGAVWALTGASWSAYRIGVPLIVATSLIGARRRSPRRERFVWVAAFGLLVAVGAVWIGRAPGTEWVWRTIAAGGSLLLAAWVAAAFEVRAHLREARDVLAIAAGLAALFVTALPEAWFSHDPVNVATLLWNCVAVAAVSVYLGAESRWNRGGALVMAGALVQIASNTVFFFSGGESGAARAMEWLWIAALCLLGSAMWRSETYALQRKVIDTERFQRRLEIVAVALPAAGGCLAVALHQGSASLWVGVGSMMVAAWRSAAAVREATRARESVVRALTRERDARLDERGALKAALAANIATIRTAAERLEGARSAELLQQAHDVMTALLDGKRPDVPVLEDLERAVLEATGPFNAGTQWQVRVERSGPAERWDEVSWTVVRECAMNVAKHSRARHAWVDVRLDDHACVVEVRDDGVGTAGAMEGLGWRGMRALVEDAGGRVQVSRNAGGGTCVITEVPAALGADG